MVIGITGGHGTGKSSLAKLMGYEVIDVDGIVQRLLTENERLKSELIEEFETCERKELDNILFSDSSLMDEYNLILLKYVKPVVKTQLSVRSYAIIDALLLYEMGLDKLCKFTIAVLSSRELRVQRIMERDELSREEAEMRIDAYKPDEYYLKKTPFTVNNDGGDLTNTARMLKERIIKYSVFQKKSKRVLDVLYLFPSIVAGAVMINIVTGLLPIKYTLVGVGTVAILAIIREAGKRNIEKKAKSLFDLEITLDSVE